MVPSVKPVTVPVVAVAARTGLTPPAGREVIWYPVMPCEAAFGGATKLTNATVSPAVATMFVGISGVGIVGRVTVLLVVGESPLFP